MRPARFGRARWVAAGVGGSRDIAPAASWPGSSARCRQPSTGSAAGSATQLDRIAGARGRTRSGADCRRAPRADPLAVALFFKEGWRQIWSTPGERLNREIRSKTELVGTFPGFISIIRSVERPGRSATTCGSEGGRHLALDRLAPSVPDAASDAQESIRPRLRALNAKSSDVTRKPSHPVCGLDQRTRPQGPVLQAGPASVLLSLAVATRAPVNPARNLS